MTLALQSESDPAKLARIGRLFRRFHAAMKRHDAKDAEDLVTDLHIEVVLDIAEKLEGLGIDSGSLVTETPTWLDGTPLILPKEESAGEQLKLV